MRKIISYGAGVGSTALICYLLEDIDQYKIIFVDHGADLPETYKYVQYIQKKLGIQITTIKPKKPLYDFLADKGWVPSIHWRACTNAAKLTPFYQYVKKEAEIYLGITYDERKRVRDPKLKRITLQYPLVYDEITRRESVQLIEATGLDVPMRSGCYFCPFQSRNQWRWLYRTHPDLFKKAIDLEKNAQEHRKMTALMKNGRTLQSLGVEFDEQQELGGMGE